MRHASIQGLGGGLVEELHHTGVLARTTLILPGLGACRVAETSRWVTKEVILRK